jgi:hypothetical protein
MKAKLQLMRNQALYCFVLLTPMDIPKVSNPTLSITIVCQGNSKLWHPGILCYTPWTVHNTLPILSPPLTLLHHLTLSLLYTEQWWTLGGGHLNILMWCCGAVIVLNTLPKRMTVLISNQLVTHSTKMVSFASHGLSLVYLVGRT